MPEIAHIVLVSWSANASEADQGSIRTLARSLRADIPGIVRLVEGPSVSPEGLEGGYDYGLAIDFTDAAARDAYLTHPAHLPLAEMLRANAAAIVVFDLNRE